MNALLHTIARIGVALVLLGGGCTMIRYVELVISDVEVRSGAPDCLDPVEAEALFREVSDRFGLVVEGPFEGSPDGGRRVFMAFPPVMGPGNRVEFTLQIEEKQIRFYSSVQGTREEFAGAQEVATDLKRELTLRGIEFKENLVRRTPFWGP